MSTDSGKSSGTSGLAFVVGGLVVIVAGLVWYMASDGDFPFKADEPEIQIDLPD